MTTPAQNDGVSPETLCLGKGVLVIGIWRRLTAAWLLVTAACLCASALGCASSVDDDEQLILFPTFAVESGPSTWTAHIRGWIYEPEVGEKRQFLMGELEKLRRHNFDLRNEDFKSTPTTSTPHFSKRAAMFLVDNERRKRVHELVRRFGRAGSGGVPGAGLTISESGGRHPDPRRVRPGSDLTTFRTALRQPARRYRAAGLPRPSGA